MCLITNWHRESANASQIVSRHNADTLEMTLRASLTTPCCQRESRQRIAWTASLVSAYDFTACVDIRSARPGLKSNLPRTAPNATMLGASIPNGVSSSRLCENGPRRNYTRASSRSRVEREESCAAQASSAIRPMCVRTPQAPGAAAAFFRPGTTERAPPRGSIRSAAH